MSRKIVIVGAGGHAGVVVDAALRAGLEIEAIYDDDTSLHGVERFGKTIDAMPEPTGVPAIVAIGSIRAGHRSKLTARLTGAGWSLATVIHPSAVIADTATIGPGSFVGPGVVVNAGARVGTDVILNSRSLIEHDAIVGDHTHVAPGALVLGDAQVGADTFVGAGSVIRQGITVGDRVTVGAGAVVIGAVRDDLVVTGVPARPLNRPIG